MIPPEFVPDIPSSPCSFCGRITPGEEGVLCEECRVYFSAGFGYQPPPPERKPMNPTPTRAEAETRLKQINAMTRKGDFSWSYDDYVRLQEIVDGPQKIAPIRYLRDDEADTRRPRRRR